MFRGTVAYVPFESDVVLTTRLPNTRNCAAAIFRLPQDAQVIDFHIGGSGDLGRLPYSEIYGDCRVRIGLSDRNEISSWTAVGLAANLIMTACTVDSRGRRYSGGVGTTGNKGALQVSLWRDTQSQGKKKTSELLEE